VNPPRKRAGVATGPRRLDGAVLDVATMARELGDSEKGIRAKVARGLLPYRRLGVRVIFVRAEVQDFLRQLPGVSVNEALANVVARRPEAAR
jgi:hypothetical protein